MTHHPGPGGQPQDPSAWPPQPQYPAGGPPGAPYGYPVPPPPPPRRWGAGRILLVVLAGLLLLVGLLVVLVIGLAALVPQAGDDATRDDRGRVTEAATVDKDALRAGDCVNDEALRRLEPGGDLQTQGTTVEVVPCAQRHDFEVSATFTLPEGDYAEAGQLRKAVHQGCVRRLRQEWAADRQLLRDKILAYYLPPAFAAQEDHSVCMLQLASGKRMTGTIR